MKFVVTTSDETAIKVFEAIQALEGVDRVERADQTDSRLFLWAADVLAASVSDYEKARTPKNERDRMVSVYNTLIGVLEGKMLPKGFDYNRYDRHDEILSRIRDAKKSLESLER